MFYEHHSDYRSQVITPLQGIDEITALATVIDPQIDALSDRIKQAANGKSVMLANEAWVARWEKILGVTTPLGSTLQARREALKAKLMTKPPINLNTLKGIIEAYMGVEVDITQQEFVLRVTYRGESRVADLNTLYVTMYNTIPANLIVTISYAYATWGEILANNWGVLKQKTWGEIKKGV